MMSNYEKELLFAAWENYKKTGSKQYGFLMKSSETAVHYQTAAIRLVEIGFIAPVSNNFRPDALYLSRSELTLVYRLLPPAFDYFETLKA